MQLPIYLDYSATTPVDPRVVDKMLPFLKGSFGNPASRSHAYGWEAEQAVEQAREDVAALVNCDSKELVWTSGATESINLALKGAAHFYSEKGKHLVTTKTEHKATLDSMRELERQGFEVTYLEVLENGLVDLEVFKAALRSDTILVSMMYVNNEIGVVQDIAAMGEICRERGVLLHVRRKPRVRIEAQIHGGGHERGFRSGTLASHQIVGMGEAFRLARLEMVSENERIRMLRDRLWAGLKQMDEVYLNGDMDQRVPHNLNVSFNYVEGESLIMAIKELAVSSGSACTSASLEPSYVLRALGRSDELAHSSIRFTVGRFTTVADVDFAISLLQSKVAKLREMSPLWEMVNEGVDLNSVQWAAH
jgi:cysteine desulfurase